MKRKRTRPPLIDNVLLCVKERQNRRFHIRAVHASDLKVEAATLEIAEELLVKEVWNRYDLDEPFGLKYADAPPAQTKSNKVLLEVAANEVADALEPARYFREGFCSVCQSGKGGRNDVLLELQHIPRGVKSGLLVRFQPYLKCGMRVGRQLLNARICQELESICDPLVEFREVRVRPNRACNFREVIPRPVIPDEVPANRKGRIGGICVKCAAKFIYSEMRPDSPGSFITVENVERIRLHGVAAIGDESKPLLCMTSEVWQKIARLPEARGLMTSEIGELSRNAINRKPKLEKITPFKI